MCMERFLETHRLSAINTLPPCCTPGDPIYTHFNVPTETFHQNDYISIPRDLVPNANCRVQGEFGLYDHLLLSADIKLDGPGEFSAPAFVRPAPTVTAGWRLLPVLGCSSIFLCFSESADSSSPFSRCSRSLISSAF